MSEARLDGKVAVVTGGGRGIGRGEAMMLAAQGASVVVNDLGGSWDGQDSDSRPASEVVAEIVDAGGRAEANFDDISSPEGAKGLIDQAIETFGGLDIVVNNAGILRDGMVFSIDPAHWQSVLNVHLMGHFLPTQYATAYWREQSKATGETPHRAIVNTTSESGLFGNAGQSNYAAAKMGIIGMTISVAKEVVKYGVTVNAIAPRARTRLTTTTFEKSDRSSEFAEAAEDVFDPMDPDNIAPFVTFLTTPAASHITGQAFIVYGSAVGRVRLPHLDAVIQTSERWTLDELEENIGELFEQQPPDLFEGPRGYARLPRQ